MKTRTMSNPNAPEPMAQGVAKHATQAEIDKEATLTQIYTVE